MPELKSYSYNTAELKTSGGFLESNGTSGESKPFDIEASIVERENEKPATTGM